MGSGSNHSTTITTLSIDESPENHVMENAFEILNAMSGTILRYV